MYSDNPRHMFQIIDFSLEPYTPINNFIVKYYVKNTEINIINDIEIMYKGKLENKDIRSICD
jgi:hypothetical protein